jgi:hypothetical protein
MNHSISSKCKFTNNGYMSPEASTKNLRDGHLVDFDWLSIENIINYSPSEITLQNWTRELDVKQYLLFSPLYHTGLYLVDCLSHRLG